MENHLLKSNDPLLSEYEVADYCRLSVTTVRRYRTKNCGPRFIKLSGTTVRYRMSDVLSWLDSQSSEANN